MKKIARTKAQLQRAGRREYPKLKNNNKQKLKKKRSNSRKLTCINSERTITERQLSQHNTEVQKTRRPTTEPRGRH